MNNNPVEVRNEYLKGNIFNKYRLLGLLPHQHHHQYTSQDPLKAHSSLPDVSFLVHRSLFFRISTLYILFVHNQICQNLLSIINLHLHTETQL